MEDCAHRYVDAGAHIYEWVGDNWQWALLPTVALAAGASLLMDQQFTARFLETIAESGTWETVHTAGVYVLGVVEMVVPLIQSLLGQVADLALQMMTFVLFLIASSIIIGTTALINHALHGRWEIVNERTAASLAGAAGWMAVIPYVGPGFAAAGRSAISAGKRERVRR